MEPMDRERWQDFNLVCQSHLDTGAKISDRWNKSADALSQMMINTAFVINAGGIVGVPALHQFLNGDGPALLSEKVAGFLFFFGMIFAGAAGIAAIWNYRTIAEQTDTLYEISSKEIEEKWRAVGEFTPSDELRSLQSAPLAGSTIVPLTFWAGWGFGVLSYFAFLTGGFAVASSAGMFVTRPEVHRSVNIFVDPPKGVPDPK